MSRTNSSAPKSVPSCASLVTLLTLTHEGTGVVTNSGVKRLDLQDETVALYHEGLLKIESKTNSAAYPDVTSWSPGPGVYYTFNWAFSNDSLSTLADADIPAAMANVSHSFQANVADDLNPITSTRISASTPFIHEGRYFFFWYSRTTFSDANATIKVNAKLIRL